MAVLADVLKMAPSAKWTYFGKVVKPRAVANDKIQPPSPTKKQEKASIMALMKLFETELKKMQFDHVCTLTRTIHRCFLDTEPVMEIMVQAGLDTFILDTLKQLRLRLCREFNDNFYAILVDMLTPLADMFDWDFFGADKFDGYITELLMILASLDDCRGTIHTEAANVLMAMCSLDIKNVCTALERKPDSRRLLEQVTHNIPCAKSFHYEALLLEVVYRIHRHLNNSASDTSKAMGQQILNALPRPLPEELATIPPKQFRQKTRELLNHFNKEVGVIQSFRMSSLVCISASKKQAAIGEVEWLDVGGIVLEAEVTVIKGSERMGGLVKLPYSSIKSVTKDDETISFIMSSGSVLRDLVEGIDEDSWAGFTCARCEMILDKQDSDRAFQSISEKIESIAPRMSVSKGGISKVIKQEVIEVSTRIPTIPEPQLSATLPAAKSSKATKTKQPVQVKTEPGSSLRRRAKPTSRLSQGSATSIDSSDFEKPEKSIRKPVPTVSSKKKNAIKNAQPAKKIKAAPASKAQTATKQPQSNDLTAPASKKMKTQHGPQKKAPVKEPPEMDDLSTTETKEKPSECAKAKKNQAKNTRGAPSKTLAASTLRSTKPKRQAAQSKPEAIPAFENCVPETDDESTSSPDASLKLRARPPQVKQSETFTSALKLLSLENATERPIEVPAVPIEVASKAKRERTSSKRRQSADQPHEKILHDHASDMSSVEYFDETPMRKKRSLVPPSRNDRSSLARVIEQPDSPAIVSGDDTPQSVRSDTKEKPAFRQLQWTQFQRCQQLVNEILSTQQAYRQHLMKRCCDHAIQENQLVVTKMSDELAQHNLFEPTGKSLSQTQSDFGKTLGQLATIQSAMGEIISHCSTTQQLVSESCQTLLSEITQKPTTDWRHDLEHLTKTTNAWHAKQLAQARAKLDTIEKNFNTDDLLMMQQMLQRI